MNNNEIEQFILDLDWNKSLEIQENAIKNLENVDSKSLYKLIQPKSKSCWENAAKVLKKIGYPKIKEVIPELLEWLQDLNWPGVNIIFEILQEIEVTVLLPYIEEAIIRAHDDDDELWIMGIKELILKIKIDIRSFKKYEIVKEIILLENG